MKKLAIVAFALVLAMTFVGCGVQDRRFFGTWDYTYGKAVKVEDEYLPPSATRFEFNKDGTVSSYEIDYQYGEPEVTFKVRANTKKDGTWLVINNQILEIEDHSSTYDRKWVVEFSELNKKMKWTDKKNDKNTAFLVKATVKKEADAE